MNIMEPLFITRRVLLTLSNGSKVMVQLSIPHPRKALFIEQMEAAFVREFNRSQPYLLNKATKAHIMRN